MSCLATDLMICLSIYLLLQRIASFLKHAHHSVQGKESGEDPPETQSDLGVSGSYQTWWDIGTLSSNRSARLKGSAKASHRLHRRSVAEIFSSDPNLAGANDVDDQGDRRQSLMDTISKKMNRVREQRRNSDVCVSPTPHVQSSSPAGTPPSLRSKDSQGQDARGNDGRATRRGNLFKWLKDGVASRAEEPMTTTTTTTTSRNKSQSSSNNNNQNTVTTPRYTRIYEEVNRLTTDFRLSTVDNTLY